jgi:acyl-CoA synthetase (AMP-forming)/AMP-acid ligase II
VSVVNPQTKADKLAHLLDETRATALVTEARLAAVVAQAASRATHLRSVIVAGEVPAEVLASLPGGARWDDALAGEERTAPPPRVCLDIDLAAIVYTSGSTGDPKGVMLTHRNMLAATLSVSTYLGLREDDVILMVLSMTFSYGLYQLIMSVRLGARLVIERSFTFPAAVLGEMVAERVTVFPAVPTMFAILTEMKNLGAYDLSAIRIVTNAAAALPVKHITRLLKLFPQAQIFSMYGQTECKRVSYLPPADLARKPTSIGIAIPNTELWLVDESDQKVPPGTAGQLVVRGATVMQGYWEKPEATALKLRPGPVPGEKVLYTGDLCRQDEEGYLYFVSRMDDIIKSGGEKVAPLEIERAIGELAGVEEVAVIGVPDELLGQAVKAFVVLAPGAELTAKDIQRECQRRLESLMVPKHVAFVPDLPRTPTGKIKKTELA